MTSRLTLISAAIATFAVAAVARSAVAEGHTELRAPSSFMDITGDASRSVALFKEAGKVITDARCVNCHPRTDRPLQGDAGRLHLPRVVGGEAGMGSPGSRPDLLIQNMGVGSRNAVPAPCTWMARLSAPASRL